MHTDGFAKPGTEGNWVGVDVEDGHVTSLSFRFPGQTIRRIPPELGKLTNLERLDLSSNQLSGIIPSELINLSMLEDLYLHYNCLSEITDPTLLSWLKEVNRNKTDWLETQSISASERAVLIAFYNKTGGDRWKGARGWKTRPLHTDGFGMPGTEGQWYGVQVNARHVTGLGMIENTQMSGSIQQN